MRLFLSIILSLQFNFGFSQTNFIGKYKDYSGYSIEFKSDQTFEFNYQFDLASGWALGTWNRHEDTIQLIPTLILDTLIREGIPDSLVLSLDITSERITMEQFAIDQITSGGQLPTYVPEKLLYRNNRLYKFDKKGKVKRKKEKGVLTQKKYDPSFFRTE